MSGEGNADGDVQEGKRRSGARVPSLQLMLVEKLAYELHYNAQDSPIQRYGVVQM
jgi:hypothetical protein